MHRRALILGSASLLAACVTNERPDDPGDACDMFEKQDGWWRSVKRAEQRWGAPPDLQLAIIRQESGFNHNARPARGRPFLFIFPGRRPSSAHGYAQALSSTWEEYERARGDSGADRNEFSDAADFVSWYCAGTQRQLGIPYQDARNHYLAYHEGRGGYSRGSYQGNSTLLASAARAQGYRDTYASQLSRCEGRLNRWWLPF